MRRSSVKPKAVDRGVAEGACTNSIPTSAGQKRHQKLSPLAEVVSHRRAPCPGGWRRAAHTIVNADRTASRPTAAPAGRLAQVCPTSLADLGFRWTASTSLYFPIGKALQYEQGQRLRHPRTAQGK